MDVTPQDKLIWNFQMARTYYDEGMSRVKTPLMDTVVETVPMITKELIFAFADRLPKLRPWAGARKKTNLVIENYSIKADKFEETVSVSREHVEDDRIGIYAQRFARLGEACRKWPEFLMRDMLKNGKNETGFDGKKVFATDHYVSVGKKSGTQANLFTAKPLNRANFVSVYQTMMGLLGPDGEPLDDFGDEVYLVHEASNAEIAQQICSAPINILDGTATNGSGAIFGAGVNTVQAWAKPLLVKSLGVEPGVWYLIDAAGEKPLIFGARYMPDLVPRVALDDPHVFDLDEFLWGTRARGKAGLGVWWKMARVEPS